MNKLYFSLSELLETKKDCYELLASQKWAEGFSCRNCGATSYNITKNCTRECKVCGKIHTPIENSVFENSQFSIRRAMLIAYDIENGNLTIKSIAKKHHTSRVKIFLFSMKMKKYYKDHEKNHILNPIFLV